MTPGPPKAETLGTRIRRLRTERGWTQRELAEPRYDRGFLAKVETGQRPPSDEVLGYLAERLGRTVGELRFGRPPGAAEALWAELDQGYRALGQGRVADAEVVFADAGKRAADYHLADVECYARFCLAEVRWQRFDVAAAMSAFEHAGLLAAAAPPWLRAMIVHRWSGCQFLSGFAGTAIASVETALAEVRAAEPVDADAELCLLTALIHPLVEMGGLRRARRAAEEGRLAAALATRPDFVARYHRQASQVWQTDGLVERAEADLTEAVRLFASLGHDRDAARCRWARGYLFRHTGRLDEARAELTIARDALTDVGSEEGVFGTTIELAEVRRRQGAPDEAEALIAGIRPLLDSARDVESLGEVHRMLGLIAQERGDLPGATRLLREAADDQERGSLRGALVTTSLYLGDVLRARGLLGEAVSAYQRGVRAAVDTDSGPLG
ncbi:helix-turn-helix domain-containing protein [Amycolatopsis sp. H20-H5]|uniref:helix-turn-helix domain-containing protein n=1 Tax=Amycolatopsis sp. H20-H5 TaxID=3046309 RepID=UPI002DBF1B16|nr:helix-turn-helix domain-containing protein [Amycolatopsis sp. H20-H5]MEC3979735.1 helix-turn-helix domain-containing protein [Amycolatopsis sp. H20-H5]